MKRSLHLIFLLFPIVLSSQSEKSTEFTLIDIYSSLEVVLLDRLDPGVKRTEAQYFQHMLEKEALEIVQEFFKVDSKRELQIDPQIIEILSKDFQNLPNPLSVKAGIKKLKKNNIEHVHYIQITTKWFKEDDVLGKQRLDARIKPNLETVTKVFDTSGKVLQKNIARGVVDDFIEIESFNKSSQASIDKLVSKMRPLLKETLDRNLSRIK